MPTRTPNRTPAVLIHDGARWILPGESPRALPGPPDAIPSELLAALPPGAPVRLLLEGEVRRLEAALPPRLRWAEAQTLFAQEAADLAGADPEGLICASQAHGVGMGATALAGLFPRERVEALRAAVGAAGHRFGGVAPLALACAAAWRVRKGAGQTLALVGQGQTLIVPPPPAAPSPLPGGLRHAATDAQGWVGRFVRGARFLQANTPLRVVAPAADAEGERLAEALAAGGGFAEARAMPSAPLLAEAARLMAAVRPNRLGQALPLANPWEPRKRFPHGWIVAPCAVLLALPFLWGRWQDARMAADTRRYRADAAEWLPLEKAVKAAQARKEAAQRALAAEEALQRALADRRRPLAAFVHMAYFFCRNAGDSVLLDGLEGRGAAVSARGVYADPEDGARLKAALAAFAARRGLRVTGLSETQGKDAEGLAVTRFEVTVDAAGLGGAK